ncbi:MAG: hypothetical protein ACTSPM_07530 [Candidatus Heimdallarchaeota archaeon]
MSEENNQVLAEDLSPEEVEIEVQEFDEENMLIEEEIFVDSPRKFTFRSFLKMSGITIILLLVSAVIMLVGLIVFYYTAAETVKNVGFWLIISGVIVFLLTIIFGFERIE